MLGSVIPIFSLDSISLLLREEDSWFTAIAVFYAVLKRDRLEAISKSLLDGARFRKML